MKAKTTKILSALMIVAMILMIVGNIAYATSPKDFKGTTGFSGESSITSLGNSVIGLVRLVGTILAVVILIVLGIKYMMGSTEEKAEYKKSMMPYLIGALLLFGTSTVISIIYNFAKGIN